MWRFALLLSLMFILFAHETFASFLIIIIVDLHLDIELGYHHHPRPPTSKLLCAITNGNTETTQLENSDAAATGRRVARASGTNRYASTCP